MFPISKPLQKIHLKKKNHWNHLTRNRIDVISICFRVFNFCSTCKLSSVRFDSVPYFSACSFQEQCCHQFPTWSKHNLLTWLLPDPKLWQTYFLPFRLFFLYTLCCILLLPQRFHSLFFEEDSSYNRLLLISATPHY